MPHWSQKTVRYQAGVVIQLGGFLVFIIGFGSPAWTQMYSKYQADTIVSYHGLWQICGQTVQSCITYEELPTGIPPWHDAARALCAVALVFGFTSAVLLICFNFTSYSRLVLEDIRTVRVLPTFAGIFGVIGSSIYAIRTQVIVSPTNASLSWAFGLAVLGSCMISASACLMTPSAGGRRADDPSNRTRMWSTSTSMPGSSGGGLAFWPGPPGGPADNPAFDGAVFVKPPDFIDAPPSYEDVMRGNV